MKSPMIPVTNPGTNARNGGVPLGQYVKPADITCSFISFDGRGVTKDIRAYTFLQ